MACVSIVTWIEGGGVGDWLPGHRVHLNDFVAGTISGVADVYADVKGFPVEIVCASSLRCE